MSETRATCASMPRLILGAVEGTLGTEDLARLELHLVDCARCRAALAEQRAIKRVLAGMEWPEVSRGFAARVRARVEEVPGFLELVNWRVWTLRLAPIGLLLLAVIVLGPDRPVSVTSSVSGPDATAWTTVVVQEANEEMLMLLSPEVSPVTLAAPYAGAGDGR